MNLACRIVWSVIATAATTASISIHVSGAAHCHRMLGSCSTTIHRPLTHLMKSGGFPRGTIERFFPLKVSSHDSTGDITVDDEYIQRFGNVERLYRSYRRDGNNDILHRLLNTHVCVIGLGGVGSWVVEALARSGIGHSLHWHSSLSMFVDVHYTSSIQLCCSTTGRMTLIDMDDICISNTNRQVMAQTRWHMHTNNISYIKTSLQPSH